MGRVLVVGVATGKGTEMSFRSLLEDSKEYDTDSSDISWHDSDEDDDAIETDDSLDDDELGSGDEC